MTVDPVADDIREFIEEDDGQPFVMLNLLAFEPDGGREGYAEYTRQTAPHLERVGGEVLYFGETGTAVVADEHRDWDAVILVKYASRAKFLEMVGDPEYQEISKLRTAALADAVLQPTRAWSGI